jgi:hypothetical protein
MFRGQRDKKDPPKEAEKEQPVSGVRRKPGKCSVPEVH